MRSPLRWGMRARMSDGVREGLTPMPHQNQVSGLWGPAPPASWRILRPHRAALPPQPLSLPSLLLVLQRGQAWEGARSLRQGAWVRRRMTRRSGARRRGACASSSTRRATPSRAWTCACRRRGGGRPRQWLAPCRHQPCGARRLCRRSGPLPPPRCLLLPRLLRTCREMRLSTRHCPGRHPLWQDLLLRLLLLLLPLRRSGCREPCCCRQPG